VIVRILSEAQYELPDDQAEHLNELDNRLVDICENGDEAAFLDAWGKLLEFVRSSGRRVDDDELVGSDVILPPPDITMAEAAAEFTGEGLIPD
jgi:hypothetical protein